MQKLLDMTTICAYASNCVFVYNLRGVDRRTRATLHWPKCCQNKSKMLSRSWIPTITATLFLIEWKKEKLNLLPNLCVSLSIICLLRKNLFLLHRFRKPWCNKFDQRHSKCPFNLVLAFKCINILGHGF